MTNEWILSVRLQGFVLKSRRVGLPLAAAGSEFTPRSNDEQQTSRADLLLQQHFLQSFPPKHGHGSCSPARTEPDTRKKTTQNYSFPTSDVGQTSEKVGRHF